jgi:hypothetical protein
LPNTRELDFLISNENEERNKFVEKIVYLTKELTDNTKSHENVVGLWMVSSYSPWEVIEVKSEPSRDPDQVAWKS